MRLFKTQVSIAATTVILLKLRGKKAHGNGTGKCPICRLLTCELFLVIRHTGILSCSEIKILFSKNQSCNHHYGISSAATTIARELKEKHKEQMQKQARVLDGKIQPASGENLVPSKRPVAPGSGDSALRLLGWRPLELFWWGLDWKIWGWENSSPPNQNKATERWLRAVIHLKKGITRIFGDRNWPSLTDFLFCTVTCMLEKKKKASLYHQTLLKKCSRNHSKGKNWNLYTNTSWSQQAFKTASQ